MANATAPYTCAVLTVSTAGAAGLRQDTSGPAAQEMLREAGFEIRAASLVPDDVEAIVAILADWADEDGTALIVTTGGTGLAPSDVTPEATRRVVEREVPGMAEAMRVRSLAQTPMAMISRGVAGTRGRSLIVNLPGSPRAVRECLAVIIPVLPHAIALIRDDQTSH